MASNPDWMDQANCVGTDPEAWFPGKGGRLSGVERRICEACQVRDECLQYALEFSLRGTWGGLSEGQRRGMKPRSLSEG